MRIGNVLNMDNNIDLDIVIDIEIDIEIHMILMCLEYLFDANL